MDYFVKMPKKQPRGVTVAQLVLVQLAQVRILAGLPLPVRKVAFLRPRKSELLLCGSLGLSVREAVRLRRPSAFENGDRAEYGTLSPSAFFSSIIEICERLRPVVLRLPGEMRFYGS